MFTPNLTKTLSRKIKLQPRPCKIMVLLVDLVADDWINLLLEADPLPDDNSSQYSCCC
jgi:hypothetical protein